jgi:RNase adaptor protein for sRNA GlmZ degradation
MFDEQGNLAAVITVMVDMRALPFCDAVKHALEQAEDELRITYRMMFGDKAADALWEVTGGDDAD